jgi:hypothetical protein|nr:MAG TPA: structural protein [Caudoviricetes sp.]
MSKYSEVIGSFERKGNFPLEANYIFANEQALKDFFALPENYAIMHKGLLKVVEDDGNGNQVLYWVTKKQTNDELEFTKVVGSSDIPDIQTELAELQKKVDKEIEDRKTADNAIWGTTDHSQVPTDLNSLLKISAAIEDLRQASTETDETVATIKEELKATVGTSDDDIRAYLQTLSYKTLTDLSIDLNKFLKTIDIDTTEINTLPELQRFLTGYTDSDTLKAILKSLHNEVLGDPTPTTPFRTLRGVEDFVRTLKSELEAEDANLQTELDQTQIGVGLDSSGIYSPDKETFYLKEASSVMNALKILDSLINEAINNTNIQAVDTPTVNMTVSKYVDRTDISADVRVSTVDGNGIAIKNDGLFYNLRTDYTDGILTVYVNDKVVSQHSMGLSSVVESAKYDPDQEAIVMVFKLLNGEKQEILIPVGNLIREWEIDNSQPTKVVEMEKVESVGPGKDKLSADVRLYVDKYQILVKEGNTLYVKGTTDNLMHNDTALDVVITTMQTKDTEISNKLDTTAIELDNHKNSTNNPHSVTKEQVGLGKVDNTSDLEKPISQATHEEFDKVYDLIDTKTDITDLNSHINNHENPHQVTKEQVGLGKVENLAPNEMPISDDVKVALDTKADLKHTHEVYDIIDLDRRYVVLGFVDALADLPADPEDGDQYAVQGYNSVTSSYNYSIARYYASENSWKESILSVGGVVSVKDGYVWELTTQGRRRILDAVDYKFFYDKGWNETKDLIEKVELVTEDDVKIKVTTKTAYADPSTDEATAPTVTPVIEYIEMPSTDSIAITQENNKIKYDLRLDTTKDNEIQISINENGLSAELVWGEYD